MRRSKIKFWLSNGQVHTFDWPKGMDLQQVTAWACAYWGAEVIRSQVIA